MQKIKTDPIAKHLPPNLMLQAKLGGKSATQKDVLSKYVSNSGAHNPATIGNRYKNLEKNLTSDVNRKRLITHKKQELKNLTAILSRTENGESSRAQGVDHRNDNNAY